MAYSVIAERNFDYATAIFDDLRSKIEKTKRDPKIPYVRFICTYLKFLYPTTYPTTYPTNSDATFPKVGQHSLEVKPLPNEKAKVTKEKGTSSSTPKDVSQQTSLDAFMGLSSTSSAIPTSTVPSTMVAVTSTVTPPIISAPPHPQVGRRNESLYIILIVSEEKPLKLYTFSRLSSNDEQSPQSFHRILSDFGKKLSSESARMI
ncbi:hypothetical protein L6452_02006 [Arctium lappa]|uniref:Uncharacterized protein n=1 Tax=Arctium lappa TaxID=4217 RepID=A0ACB9FHM2_ARCLA|nr:hypothetical protein L6452_02006 [Arctium lappa]